MKFYVGKFNAYQRTYVISPKQYFYLFLKECENQIDNLKNNSQGSVIKFITKNMLESITIIEHNNSDEINDKINYVYQNLINLNKKLEFLLKIKQIMLHKYFK
ncbi:hypothetical protein [Mycoplasma miroungirhinis]|uniref:Type I restriction modification DNA specificity domain-containing protein n=1 Tax=Mycoplasma miroungirhinis TaxID=754516 RepID=A0A6M4JB05_9MOLU|nr:hypothetical protein [Mycoplasma miroungirhinis]QJR44163.1 hypothetical protein HLA92_01815 [Mycoplasma miroungirhinis]